MYFITRRIIIFIVCKILFKVEYRNEEILRKYDKCLICPNHSRIYDPIFIYPKVSNMYGMAKSELFKHKLLANFLNYHNIFPVDRESTDAKSLRKALKLMKNNDKIKLLIFPEGKVLKSRCERGIVKNGAVYIAAMAKVPIIPIYITARPKYFSKVVVKFGKPIFYDRLQLKDKNKIIDTSKQLLKEIYSME
ncbi:MAG: 1-acyl-sn-glycerol-3-phosphate acyltransferase [Clostridia bacterium]|nr:1-acyl-sn-glycerol-3-phosphate acyltransferase [Clostridia bacterium]